MESYMDVLKDRADQEECYAWAVYEIERLREAAKDRPKDRPNEAADEIERLREENDELKDLLQCVVNYTGASVSSNRFTFHAALKEGE